MASQQQDCADYLLAGIDKTIYQRLRLNFNDHVVSFVGHHAKDLFDFLNLKIRILR